MEISRPSPKELGYRFPAEFELHAATWLSWPHKEASWPGKIDSIYTPYCLFIKALAENESVHINVVNEEMKSFAIEKVQAVSANMDSVKFYTNPTNDAWCRDHGPAFLINPGAVHGEINILLMTWMIAYPHSLRQLMKFRFYIRTLLWKAAQWISTEKER